MRIAEWMIAVFFALPSHAQESPRFDAAVVKPAPPNARLGGYRIGPASLTSEAVPLHFLILQAYGISDYELQGVAGWMDSALFAISASAPGRADRDTMMGMLRGLLADQFQLKVHRETRPAPVYELVVASGGSKLKPLREGEPPAPMQAAGGRMTVPVGETIADLVRYLNSRGGSMAIGRLVVDRTGLTGKYRITLEFDNIVDPDGKSGRLDGDIPSSLSQQLGLKLQPGRADVTYLVVDQAVRPQ